MSRNYANHRAPEVGAPLELPDGMLAILLILLVLALLGGGFGYRSAGPWGWSPAGILVVILVVMALTGRL
ncbi:MAG: hypothetical protein ABI678_12320 [Kofleriaceae bacterium]